MQRIEGKKQREQDKYSAHRGKEQHFSRENSSARHRKKQRVRKALP
jgi:hypothetical protein